MVIELYTFKNRSNMIPFPNICVYKFKEHFIENQMDITKEKLDIRKYQMVLTNNEPFCVKTKPSYK